MEYRCKKCGSPVSEGAKFCRNCGEPDPIQETPSMRQCPFCGNEVSLTAKFCRNCGQPIESQEQPEPEPEPEAIPETSQEPEPAPERPAPAKRHSTRHRPARRKPVRRAVLSDLTRTVSAGELPVVAKLAMPAVEGLGEAAQVVNPGLTVLNSFKRFGRLVTDWKALVGAVVMAVVWTLFWLWNRSGGGNIVSEILSAVTFAEGGTRGNAGQFLGGIFGKGLVMTGISSLFSGGFSGILSGVRRMFGKGMHIGGVLAGFGIAVIGYQLFAGYAGSYGTAIAVSGALVSLQALGGRACFLRSIAMSLLSKKEGSIRVTQDVRVKSLLTGMAVGFAISAALSSFYIPWWMGLIFLVPGIVLLLVIKDSKTTKDKAVKA